MSFVDGFCYIPEMSGHRYTLASDRDRINKEFDSRESAKEYLYRYCEKKGYTITRVYDDKHDKTYICDNDGVRFFINRW